MGSTRGGNIDAYDHGGYGGYSTGEIELNLNDKLYINVGGTGSCGWGSSSKQGGYNGGGSYRHSAGSTHHGHGGYGGGVSGTNGVGTNYAGGDGTQSSPYTIVKP